MNKAQMWSEKAILLVWNKGVIVPGYNSSIYRKDSCGAWMMFSQHGNRDSDMGWEVDHIYPSSLGGSDLLTNLQPLHWKNNVEKGESIGLRCAVSARSA